MWGSTRGSEQRGEGWGGQAGDEGRGATPAAPGAAAGVEAAGGGGEEAAGLEAVKEVSSPKRRKMTHTDADGRRADRKRKPNSDEFAMLGLQCDDAPVNDPDESELEGFRSDCQSSMRSG